MIDLRSDTVTKPTAAMREAMASAVVGDDVYGEDPTINLLEHRSAELMGKQAALFVPSGSMGNLIGLKLHSNHGDEVVCDHRAHVFDWEMSMPAWFAGCQLRPVTTVDGIMRWGDIEPHVRRESFAGVTAAINLENSHNMGGGTVYPQDEFDLICDKAHELGLKIHLDGARIFNAAVASGIPVARIAKKADTVMFCLSKGLGAPVGSILTGTEEAIARGRNYRKCLGGGMRQAGVLAAAGLVALEETPKILAIDHAHAKVIAEGIAGLLGISIDPSTVQTNIVIFDIAGTGIPVTEFEARMKRRDVLLSGVGGSRVRMVTHYDVTRSDCERAIQAVRESVQTART